MSNERKAALLAYCRIEAIDLDTAQEQQLQAMYDAAVDYMTIAGVSAPAVTDVERTAAYDQCVNALVLDAWDHRGGQTTERELRDNPAFRRRVTQLKLSEPR